MLISQPFFLSRILIANGIIIISDEVYEKFNYDGNHVSIASFNEDIKKLTFTVNAVSKTYSMTGWRIGYGWQCGRDDG